MIKRALVTLLPLLLLGACGSSSGGASATSDASSSGASSRDSATTSATSSATDSTTRLSADKPCAVVTPDDVAAAFGGRAATGTTDPILPGRCTWTVSGSTYGDGKVSLYFASVQSRAAFDAAEAGLPGVQKVDGIGDAAFFQPLTNALEVAHGDTVFTTQGTFGSAAVLDADKKLALAALGS